MTAAFSNKRAVRADHYAWISEYLHRRRMAGAVRVMMGLIAASMAVCLFALLASADGPSAAVPVGMMWFALCGGIAGAALWAWRWPTRRQSLAFAYVSNAAVALACLAYPDPQGALTGCIAFATTGAFIAFFHHTALVMYNFAVAATVAVIAATRVAASGHLALATVDLFLVAQVNIAMPVAIHVLLRALRGDLEQADRDPLTGLLNRRSFQHYAMKMIGVRPASTGGYLLVAVIDLDDFKRINDTRGHHGGDDALVAVARALSRATLDVGAVVARSGGEEFIVAVIRQSDDASSLARGLCEAIAVLPEAITASVGTACSPIMALRGDDAAVGASLDRLIAAADEAMYSAKRAGGNGFHHAR